MSDRFSHIALSERKVILRVFDVGFILLSLWVFSTYVFKDYYINFTLENTWVRLLTLALYFLGIGQILEMYTLPVATNRFQIFRSIFLTSMIVVLVYTLTPVYSFSLPSNRLQIVYLFLLILCPVVVWRFLYISFFDTPRYFKNIAVIGHSSQTAPLLELIRSHNQHDLRAYISDKKLAKFQGFVSIHTGALNSLVKENRITEIVINTEGFNSMVKDQLNKEMLTLFEQGITIKSFETFYEELTQRIPKENLDDYFYKSIYLSEHLDNKMYLFVHRLMDVIVALLGSLFMVFLLPFIYIMNLFANKGPLFYTQNRVGARGKCFKIYKLRSMVPDAEKNGAVWASKNDTRTTSFGRFLRITRLDEAPQFFNILKGDMSLIGPRPERPEFVSELHEQIPFYTLRHVVKPGLTGWAQVKYPYACSVKEQEIKLRYDLFYIKERNLYLDFKIVIKTITTVLFLKGQ